MDQEIQLVEVSGSTNLGTPKVGAPKYRADGVDGPQEMEKN